MNKPIEAVSRVVTEARMMLDNVVLDTRRGKHLPGEWAIVTLDPCMNGTRDTVDVPITVFPIGCNPRDLLGTAAMLRPVEGEDGFTHIGVLDSRSQVLFRGVAEGSYRVELAPARDDTVPRWDPLVQVQSPGGLLAAAAATGESNGVLERYRSASGKLTMAVRREDSGGLELDFEAVAGPGYDGQVVGFRCGGEEGKEPDLLLAVLGWAPDFGSCVAEVHLGRGGLGGLALPLEPRPVESLSEELAGFLSKSVARADDPTRAAWARVLEERTLPDKVRLALRTALEG